MLARRMFWCVGYWIGKAVVRGRRPCLWQLCPAEPGLAELEIERVKRGITLNDGTATERGNAV